MCLLERDLCLVASEGLEVRDPRLDSRAVPVPGSAPGSAPGVANDRAGLPDARRPELTPRGQEAASVPCSRRGRSEVAGFGVRRRPAGCRASSAPGRRRSRLRCGGWRSALRTAGVDVRRISSRRSVQRRGGRQRLTEAIPAYRPAGGLAAGVVPPPDFESCGRPRPAGAGAVVRLVAGCLHRAAVAVAHDRVLEAFPQGKMNPERPRRLGSETRGAQCTGGRESYDPGGGRSG